MRLLLHPETPPGAPPPAPDLPPSTKELLSRLAAHEEWTKKQVEDIMTRLASLPPAEQKKELAKLEQKEEAKAEKEAELFDF